MADAADEKFALTTSRSFDGWFAGADLSIAFTTYQAGKLFLIGRRLDGRLSVFERTFSRCMGLGVSGDGRRLALATHFQLFSFDNVMAPGQTSPEGHDALYVPHVAWITGDLDAHDVGFDPAGRPVFANTLFSCVATVSDRHSFRPLWHPRFISRLAPEDRCHLNGLAMEEGKVRYVTCVAPSDVTDGWRDRRRDGGVVIDVESGETVATGLSMPHSPRLHQGKLWLLNSGTGEFGHVDLASGRFEPVAFCPGYARGLALSGNHAVIGLSMARENRTFQGLPLDDALAGRGAEARCGIIVVDITSGDTIAWIRLEGIVRELYDVAILPGVCQPSALGFVSDEIKRVISIEETA